MKQGPFFILGLALVFGMFSAALWGQSNEKKVVALNDSARSFSLAPHIHVHYSEPNIARIEELLEKVPGPEFVQPERLELSKGFIKKAAWIRFTLQNNGLTRQNWVLEIGNPLLDEVTFFQPLPEGKYQEIVTGDAFPVSSKPFATRGYNFPIVLASGSQQTYYVRIFTNGSLQVPLTLRTTSAFEVFKTREIILFSLYFGMMMALFLYNAFLAVPLRKMGYPCYVAYIAAHFLAQLSFNGVAPLLLWPDNPFWANRAIPFFVSMAAFCGMQFTFKFLETKEQLPGIYRIIVRVNPLLLATSLFLSLFGSYPAAARVVMAYLASWCLLAIFIGTTSFFKKKRQAIFYLMGWTFFLAGVLLNTLRVFGLNISFEFATYCMLAGSIIELLVLSLGLADQINIIGQEKEEVVNRLAAQNRVLRHENSERRRVENALIRTREDLENQVMDRTKDLAEANKSLLEEIDQRRGTEAKLKVAHHRAEEESMAKSRFLANMSHEIRTPLNAIIGLSELLLGEKQENFDSEKVRNYLENIHRSGYHLSQVINHILDLTKIEAGKFDLSLEAVQLPGLVQDIFEVCFPQAQTAGVKLSYHIAPEVPEWIKTDHTALRRILLNLVGNAVKFTPEGKSVNFNVNSGEKELIFIVKDEGIGIPQERQAAIFNAFEQADNTTTRKYGGTGLGLAISQMLAETLGGNITLESEQGKGSCFKVVMEMELCEPPSSRTEQPLPSTIRFNPESIVLVAEDNKTNLFVLRALLSKVGLKIHHAENGKQAVEMALALKPDLILMDMHMPVMDGLEATQQIRMNQDIKNVPIVAVTADAFKEKRHKALERGLSDYLVKPINMPELLTVLRTYLEPVVEEVSSLDTNGVSLENV